MQRVSRPIVFLYCGRFWGMMLAEIRMLQKALKRRSTRRVILWSVFGQVATFVTLGASGLRGQLPRASMRLYLHRTQAKSWG